MHTDDLVARRVARAVAQVATALQARGSAVHPRSAWPGTTAEWTGAAQAAELQLQRPVASGISRTTGTVWATLLDWPRTTEELLAAARLHHELGGRLDGTAEVHHSGP